MGRDLPVAHQPPVPCVNAVERLVGLFLGCQVCCMPSSTSEQARSCRVAPAAAALRALLRAPQSHCPAQVRGLDLPKPAASGEPSLHGADGKHSRRSTPRPAAATARAAAADRMHSSSSQVLKSASYPLPVVDFLRY